MGERVCLTCGGPLPPRKRVVCSEECRAARHREQMREWMRRHRETTGERYASRYPEDKVRKAARDRARNQGQPLRKRYPEAFAARDARRRARIAGVTVESFRHVDVFERDGWVCQLCDGPVDAGLAYPDPASKSLDHRVPVSLGGPHSLENVQLAHLGCNIAKGNRMEVSA